MYQARNNLFILLLGMFWVDKEKLQFRIPWKHGSRQGWEQNKDAVLFQMWAEHTGTNAIAQLCRNTVQHCNGVKFVFVCLYFLHRGIFVFTVGKFRRGDERSVRDPKTWKATFRCALNSLPDVQEVPNMSEKRGPNAYRVYQFLEPKKSRKARKSTGTFVNIFNTFDRVLRKNKTSSHDLSKETTLKLFFLLFCRLNNCKENNKKTELLQRRCCPAISSPEASI